MPGLGSAKHERSADEIPADDYVRVMQAMPILCVDLVLKRGQEYLLVKRRSSPEKGRWWVPGGRILKGETIERAAKRKAREELGIDIAPKKMLGVYEDHYRSGRPGSKHTVSVVILAEPKSLLIRLDRQSCAWKLSRTLPNDFKITRFRAER